MQQSTALAPMRGHSFAEVYARLEHIAKNKKDIPVDVSAMGMLPDGSLAYKNGAVHQFELTNWSAGQLASYVDVPKQYFDRLRKDNPELLALNVNHGLLRVRAQAEQENKNERRIFRTIDGKVRALVSSKFFLCDSFDIVDQLFPILGQYAFKPIASELTEKRLYIKATTDRIQGEVMKGDVVQFGVMISTSDVGAGSIAIEPYLLRLVCLNGAVMESRVRRRHIGREVGGEDFRDLYSDETLNADKQAFLLKSRDMLTGSLSPDVFNREIGKLKNAAATPIKNYNLTEVVDHATKLFGITNKEIKKEITEHLGEGNQGAGLTMWGLMNSFTAAAKNQSLSYDESVELERAAGEIVDLDERQWKHIAGK